MPQADDLMNAPQLRTRGWTDAMIRDLLGEPDKLARNPRYRSAPMMRLWSASRVEEAEASPEFAARRTAASRRSATGTASAAAKRAELQAEIARRPNPRIPALTDAELASRAVEHRNDYMAWHASGARREDFTSASVASADPAALDRWKVNYLRHALSDYEADLVGVTGKIGAREAKDLIRERVYEAIAEAYPDLTQECVRQIASRLDDPK